MPTPKVLKWILAWLREVKKFLWIVTLVWKWCPNHTKLAFTTYPLTWWGIYFSPWKRISPRWRLWATQQLIRKHARASRVRIILTVAGINTGIKSSNKFALVSAWSWCSISHMLFGPSGLTVNRKIKEDRTLRGADPESFVLIKAWLLCSCVIGKSHVFDRS